MILHRYMGSHLDDVLRDRRLKLSELSTFNDPFEAHLVIQDNFSEHDAKLRNYEEKIYRSVMPDREVKGYTPELLREEYFNSYPLLDVSFLDDASYYRFLCLCAASDPFSELLMWSHYADNHRGSRIHLDSDYFGKLVKPVRYSEEKLDAKDIKGNASLQYLNKAICWHYENEHRIRIPLGYCLPEKVTDKEGNETRMSFLKLNLCMIERIDLGICYTTDFCELMNLVTLVKERLGELFGTFVITKASRNLHSYKIDYNLLHIEETIKQGRIIYQAEDGSITDNFAKAKKVR